MLEKELNDEIIPSQIDTNQGENKPLLSNPWNTFKNFPKIACIDENSSRSNISYIILHNREHINSP